MRGQGQEEKGLFPKGMILSCVILFLLGIGCVGMNLAAGPSEEKNPMGQIADYRKKEEKKKEAEKKKLEEQKKQKKSTDEKKNADPSGYDRRAGTKVLLSETECRRTEVL